MKRLAFATLLVAAPAALFAQQPLEGPPPPPRTGRIIAAPPGMQIQTPAPAPAPGPAPAPTVIVPPTTNGTQPTIIVVQPGVACNTCVAGSTKHAKAPPKHKTSHKDSCDNIGCQSFCCEFLFQWGSCRSFFGEGRGKSSCRNCNQWP